jgi:uncharacterized protein (DUF1697 family)
MPAYVALLRAVNVGGRTVTMQTLRDALSAAGFANVRTYVQSGNVVFRHSQSAVAVAELAEHVIRNATGLDVPVIVRTAHQLSKVVDGNPFVACGADPRYCHVTFLRDAVAPKTIDVARGAPDEFAIRGREVYLHTPNGYGRTKLNNALFERALGTIATTRNWNTVTKLADMSR